MADILFERNCAIKRTMSALLQAGKRDQSRGYAT